MTSTVLALVHFSVSLAGAVEMHDPRGARDEARLLVKGCETWFIVDMEPFAAARACQIRRDMDERGANAAPLILGIDRRIEQKRVRPTVARDIDETDESILDKGGDECDARSKNRDERPSVVAWPSPREEVI